MSDQVDTVRWALDAIERRDLDTFLGYLGDGFAVELPYADVDGGSRHDKAGLGRLIGFLIATFAELSFTIDRAYQLADGNGVIIEYQSRFRSKVGDVIYANRYIAIFDFDPGGRITLWREYANPVALERAMAAIKAAAVST